MLETSAYDFFFYLLSLELLSFHLKEALYGFSLHNQIASITTLVLWSCYQVKSVSLEHKHRYIDTINL